MKKKLVGLVLVLAFTFMLAGCGNEEKVLNVYNWGEYISDGSDESFDTIVEFEKWYEENYGESVKVIYNTFASNEDMYNKISGGAVSYDVIFPSDYMVERMAGEGMLEEINFDNIPNYQYIDEDFKNLYYDPQNKYSIPYAYSMVGIIYNANEVDEADTGSWGLLWNEKYENKILQYNNPRDAFGTAMYKLGIDVNTTDKNEWQRAKEELIAQWPLVKSYVMDEIYNMMESGEASVASYYAGDYFIMKNAQAENVDLKFYYPEPTNFFVDAMCIPKGSHHKELAEIFMNYLLSEEAAVANAEYIYCPVPNSLVTENEGYKEAMGEEVLEMLYPEMDDFKESFNKYAYRNMDEEMLDFVNSLWEEVKIN